MLKLLFYLLSSSVFDKAVTYLNTNAAATPASNCPRRKARILPQEVMPMALIPSATAGLNAPPVIPPKP